MPVQVRGGRIGGDMRNVQRFGVLAVFVIGLTMAGSAPASAGAHSISGVAVFDTSGGTCPDPPADFDDFVSYPPLVMSGSLEGCWYTKVEAFKDNGAPSGIYLERRSGALRRKLERRNRRSVHHDLPVRVQVGSGRLNGLGSAWTLPAPHRGGQRNRRVRGCHRAPRLQGRRG